MTYDEALARLLGARNYKDICPDTVKKELDRACVRYRDPAKAEQAARERLHAVTGAFLTASELKKANACRERFLAGDENALTDALLLHSSTRERLTPDRRGMDILYERIFAVTGRPETLFDAACGLNPLYLGKCGFTVRGADIHGGCTDLINRWASAAGWDVRAECRDLSLSAPREAFDLALVMKLLPVLETDEKGSALRFLRALNAKYLCVTFPTRTLGGRSAGMEQNYTRWFENEAADDFRVLDRFVSGSELIYVLTR